MTKHGPELEEIEITDEMVERALPYYRWVHGDVLEPRYEGDDISQIKIILCLVLGKLDLQDLIQDLGVPLCE